MSKRSLWSILAALIVVLSMLTACGTPEPATPEPAEETEAPEESAEEPAEEEPTEEEMATIDFWYHSGANDMRDILQKYIDLFEGENPNIEVELVELPEGSYNDQVSAAAMAGDLPCVLDFDGPFVYNYAWSGYLIPLDDYISDEMREDFLPSIIDQGTYAGQLWSVAHFDSGLALWGNKAYLEAADVRIPTSVEDAWTLEEYNDALEKLQALPEVEYAIDMKTNYGVGEFYTYGYSPILQSFGGDLIDRSDYQSAEGVLNGPEGVEALTWFQGLFEQGYANPESASDDCFYGTKTCALSAIGHWGYNNNIEGLGEDLVLLPMPKFGPVHAAGMGSWNTGITSQCQYPNAAWKFVEYIHSTEAVADIAGFSGGPPARKSAIAESERYGPGGIMNIYAQQLDSIAVPRPQTPAYPVITSAFAEAVGNIIAGEDVQTQLDQAVQIIDQDIEDNAGYPTN